jgi:hypothetical protein
MIANNHSHPERSRGIPMMLPETFRGQIPRVEKPGSATLPATSKHFAVAGATRECKLAIPKANATPLEDGNNIAHGDEFLDPRSVPICRPNAAVTGGAADCFRLVRPMDADVRLA